MGKSIPEQVKNTDSRQNNVGDARASPVPRRDKERLAHSPWTLVIVTGIVISLIIVGLVIFTLNVEDDGGSSKKGEIILNTTDGSELFLNQFKGKVVVLDMFATWCEPCKEQMGELQKLSDMFSFEELVILSIGIDLGKSMSQLSNFKEEGNASWTFAMSNPEFNSKFPTTYIPTLYILDREGNIAVTHEGYTTSIELEPEIKALL